MRRVRGMLRHRRFASLAALNAAIATPLADLDARPMRRLGVSRRQPSEEPGRPALAALPAGPFVHAVWRIRRVGLDDHVDVDGHCDSVPHRLLREAVEARVTARTVELFHKGERVAVHLRGGLRGRHTTLAERAPQAHRRHADHQPGPGGGSAPGSEPSPAAGASRWGSVATCRPADLPTRRSTDCNFPATWQP